MKKAIAIFMSLLVIVFSVLPVNAVECSENEIVVIDGDINDDGTTDTADAVLLLKISAGILPSNNTLDETADIIRDGYISITDAIETLRIATGIATDYPKTYTKWAIHTEATCSKQGVSISYNIDTNEHFEKSIPINPDNHTPIVSATCIDHEHCGSCNKNLSDTLAEHTIIPATCSMYSHCSVCNTQLSETLAEHTVVPAKCTESAYCTACKTIFDEPLGHDYADDVCTRCNKHITGVEYVKISGKAICFGYNFDEVKSVMGEPSEILTDITTERSVTYYVYCEDYSKLVIITFANSDGVTSIYTTDASARFYGEKEIDFDSYAYGLTNRYLYSDGYMAQCFVDDVNDSSVYAMLFSSNDAADNKLCASGDINTYEQIIFHNVNACRAINGVSSLVYSESVATVARAHSEDMMINDYFDHVNLKGLKPVERLLDAGVRFSICGENIHVGSFMLFDINDSFYNSSSHREVMLRTDFDSLGVGLACDPNSTYGSYTTQNFIKSRA